MPKKILGIGASSGISVADIYLFEKEKIDVKNTKISDVKKEIKLVKDAIVKTSKNILSLKEKSIKKIGVDKAAIFDAHNQILNDPEMENQINEKISNEKINGLKAINDVFNNAKAIFESMGDEYFKERAADVEDVKYHLMCTFLGKQLPNLLSINKEVIIVANDLTPSETALLDKKYIKGFTTNIGGRTSHAAIMARTLEIPAVLGLKNITSLVKNAKKIAIDGSKGIVEISPNESSWNKLIQYQIEMNKKFDECKSKKAQTIDGHSVHIVANIGKSKDIDNIKKYGAEGVGLFRSEFLYMDNSNWPTEDEQYEHYKYVLSKNPNNLVVVRTLDIGGDKHLDYFNFPKEENPFLGYRAIRLCLDRKDIFKTQLKALARASIHGKLAIMFPMIATVDEFIEAKKITLKCFEEVKKAGYKVSDNIQIGMMIEIPAAAVLADQFAKHVDFFSIGTNDLIQYSLAVDRMSENVSYLYQPLNPSILRLIELTILGAKKYGKWVGMCGEVAGDWQNIPLLLGLGYKGLDELSMSASSIPKVKYVINKIKKEDCIELANNAVLCENQNQVAKLLEKFFAKNKINIE